jgi:hypothetical protein
MSIATTGVRIKASLAHVAPEVTRRIAVPLTMKLDRLHLTLQAAFGWTNTHLYAFQAAGLSWGEPDPDFLDAMGDACKTRLYDVVAQTGAKTLRYVYDFGDNWEHVLKLEKWVENGGPEGLPFLINAIGRCPPEDVGGPSGYAQLITALSDPAHPDHADTRRWVGEDFIPAKLDLSAADRKALEAAVEALAEKWRPKLRKLKK